MPFDPWPDEPDEFDPERNLPGNLEIPETPQPEVPEENLSGEVPRVFWASVILVNVALLTLSLGPMLIVFRGQWILGLSLVAVGVVALARTYQLYRKFEATRDGEDESQGSKGEKESSVDADVDNAELSDDSAERNP